MKNIIFSGVSIAAIALASGAAAAEPVSGHVNSLDELTSALWANVAANTGHAIEADIDISSLMAGRISDLETMAAGAINEGHIASSARSFSLEDAGIRMASIDVDYFELDNETGTDMYSEEPYDDTYIDSLELGVDMMEAGMTSIAATAPAEYKAVNAAWNDAPIDASITVRTGELVGLAGASTMALGAMNTGTISMGFDGAALNSALNSITD